MSGDSSSFLPVPTELKALAPFFQRAQELKVKDPAMAYWCTYYAAKQGISSKIQSKDARAFLYQVMNALEQMKADLGNEDAVSDDDAGAAYIENFALRVFNMADNEDRKGDATRSTAKKFLAAANFFELLHIFDKPLAPDIEEKIRYAKWKAADLAKAFREGRNPTPGDVNAPGNGGGAMLEPSLPHESAQSLSAWSPSPGTSAAQSPGVGTVMPPLTESPARPVDAPLPIDLAAPPPSMPDPSTPPRTGMLHLDTQGDGHATPGTWSTMATPGTEAEFYVGEQAVESPTARRESGDDDGWSVVANLSTSRQGSQGSLAAPEPAPPPPVKKVHFSPSVVGGLSDAASSTDVPSLPNSPERFAPTLPTVAESPPYADPVVLHEAAPAVQSSNEFVAPPSVPQFPVTAAPTLPQFSEVPLQFSSPPSQFPAAPPQFPSAPPQFPTAPPQFPSAPPQFPSAPPRASTGFGVQPSAPPGPPTQAISHANHHRTHAPRPPPPPRSPSPPAELTPTQISEVQKHCKFAISALDYEDVYTARRELHAALAMLEG